MNLRRFIQILDEAFPFASSTRCYFTGGPNHHELIEVPDNLDHYNIPKARPLPDPFEGIKETLPTLSFSYSTYRRTSRNQFQFVETKA